MATLELKLDRGALLGALAKAQGVVDKKSTVNVLSHLLIESTGEGQVRVTGTDFDVIVVTELSAQVLEPGKACVNGKSLFDVVKTAGSDEIHLQVQSNHWVDVTAGRSHFKLAGISAADFPEITFPEEVAWIELDQSVLRDLVDKTAFSVSDDETRMNLNGVFIRIEPGEGDHVAQITMVSTDGHRLSKVESLAEVDASWSGDQHEAIVHKKGVQELKRLLDGNADTLRLGFAKGFVVFEAGGTTFTVRQIEDSYPDYQRVIPPSSPVRLEVDRTRLLNAVKRIAVLTSSKTYIIKLELSAGQLAMTSSNPDYGEGRDEIDVDYQGDGFVIGFNYLYLLDVLGVIRGDTVVLEFSDEYGPSVITSPSEEGALFVVMPMRI